MTARRARARWRAMAARAWAGSLVAGLAACSAPPMTLTKALLAERTAEPRVVEGRYSADVQNVRGRVDVPPAQRALAVDVMFGDATEQRLPAHLHAYARNDPSQDALRATMALTPADGRRRWPEDYVPDVAARRGIGLRFFDARYFHDGTSAAEVTFSGTVGAQAVVQVVHRDALPADIAALKAWANDALPSGLAPVARAARRHPFVRVAGLRRGSARCDPVAFVGPQERRLAAEDVLLLLQPWRSIELRRPPIDDVAVEACALLLRAVHGDGHVDYLRVPLAVLREGDDLTLTHRGADVLWSRRDVWRARMLAEPGDTAEWPTPELRLAQTRVPYRFDDLHTPSTLPGTILRAMLAPLSAVIDVLAWTNPVLQKLVETMVGEPRRFEPTRSSR